MTTPTLTDLVRRWGATLSDANPPLDAVLDDLEAILPRYEAALRWAEAWAAREDATKALIAKPDHDECMAYSAAQDELQAALAAYREARS